MSIAANQAADTLSILGQQGIITSEADTPDTVYIDIDKATSSALKNDGADKMLVNVDDSTVKIDGSGQLYAVAASMALNDFSDVNITAVGDDHVLVYDSVAGEWQNKTMTVTGAFETPEGSTAAIVKTVTVNTAGNQASPASHSHGPSTTAVGSSSHTHTVNGYTSGGPKGSPATVTGYTGVSSSSSTSVNAYTGYAPGNATLSQTSHSHDLGSIAITIT